MCNVFYPVLNRIGDAGITCNGLSEVVSPPFCFNHLGVDFTRGQIVVFGEVDVEEAFVISQVEVDFSSIIQNEDLAVFEGKDMVPASLLRYGSILMDVTRSPALLSRTPMLLADTFAESRKDSSADHDVLHCNINGI